ncbi:MAG: hypothetical protein IPK78_20490 [Rhodospirillales bacterium]|nr:hypothetical protein [Rhodospirillales bacterium]
MRPGVLGERTRITFIVGVHSARQGLSLAALVLVFSLAGARAREAWPEPGQAGDVPAVIIGTSTGGSAARRYGDMRNVVDDFGAKGNVQVVGVTAAIASGSTALTAIGARFDCAQLNGLAAAGTPALVEVPGAGGSPWISLKTTISACAEASRITLATPAVRALRAVPITLVWGVDDSAAFAACAGAPRMCFVPAATYFVRDARIASGASLFGDAGLAYGEALPNGKASPQILAAPGATNVLDVAGSRNISLRGIVINCNSEPGVNGISGGSTLMELRRVTVQSCPGKGLGGGTRDTYTHIATIIGSEFIHNGTGISNLVDSTVFGGAVTSSSGNGIDMAAGSAKNNFIGLRVEWNRMDGYHFYKANFQQTIGGALDHNFRNGASVKNSIVLLSGVAFHRNGAADTGEPLADAHVAVAGPASKVVITGGMSEVGRNHDGTGNVSPKYFLYLGESTESPASVTITGTDATGFKTAFSVGGTPRRYHVDGVAGAMSVSNVSQPQVIGGKSLWGRGTVRILAGATETVTVPCYSPLAAVGPHAPYAFTLFVYASDNTIGEVHSASFDLVVDSGAVGGGSAIPLASRAYGETNGSGYFTFSKDTGTLRLSILDYRTDGDSFTLAIRNAGANPVGVGWELK